MTCVSLVKRWENECPRLKERICKGSEACEHITEENIVPLEKSSKELCAVELEGSWEAEESLLGNWNLSKRQCVSH